MGIEEYCAYQESKINAVPAFDPFKPMMIPSMEEIEKQIRNELLSRSSGIHLIEEEMRADMLAQFNPHLKLVPNGA